jgi:multiple sugar transport system ATP-binding protein
LDTPQVLYDHPNNLFVAGFIGSPSMNFFPAKLVKNDGKIFVDAGDFKVQIPESLSAPYQGMDGKTVIFGIRPENIHDPAFAPTNIHGEKVSAKVDVTELMGNETLLYLVSGKNTFVGRVDPRSHLRVGHQSELIFDMDKFHIFDAGTEEAIR